MEVYTDTNHKKWYAMASCYGVVFCDYKTILGSRLENLLEKIKQKWGGISVV